jgi:hypothetical protein
MPESKKARQTGMLEGPLMFIEVICERKTTNVSRL